MSTPPPPPALSDPATPDYAALVRFFLEPLLDKPECLSIDCEPAASRQCAWIRLALDSSDQGRALGRDGRTLQAIRVTVGLAAAALGQRVILEVYSDRHDRHDGSRPGRSPRRGPSSRAVPRPKRRID